MFHYNSYNCGRQSHDINVGDTVQSRYRAPWKGTVLELDSRGGLATVRQEIDRHGNPMRKKKIVCYHCQWFRVIKKGNDR